MDVDRGAWQALAYKSWTQLSACARAHTHTHTYPREPEEVWCPRTQLLGGTSRDGVSHPIYTIK